MSRLTRRQEVGLFLSFVGVAVSACAPIVAEPAANNPTPDEPALLSEPTAGELTVVVKPTSGEILLPPATFLPTTPATLTGDLTLSPVTSYAEASVTPEPYVPSSYIEYASNEGIEAPSNIRPETDAAFRAFYDYIFNEQFQITTGDDVRTGSLLNSENPGLTIRIAPDGTPYVEGYALDDDIAYGGGDHYFFFIWNGSGVDSVKILKYIGGPVVRGYGDYYASYQNGTQVVYDPETNSWESRRTNASELTPIPPSPVPVPTSSPSPMPTAEVIVPQGYDYIDLQVGEVRIETAAPLPIIEMLGVIANNDGPVEIEPYVTTSHFIHEGDVMYVNHIPVFVLVNGAWVFNGEQVGVVENYLGLGPAIYSIENLSVPAPSSDELVVNAPVLGSRDYSAGGTRFTTDYSLVFPTGAQRARIVVHDTRSGWVVNSSALKIPFIYENPSGSSDAGAAVVYHVKFGSHVEELDFFIPPICFDLTTTDSIETGVSTSAQVDDVRGRIGLMYNLGGYIGLQDPTLTLPGWGNIPVVDALDPKSVCN